MLPYRIESRCAGEQLSDVLRLAHCEREPRPDYVTCANEWTVRCRSLVVAGLGLHRCQRPQPDTGTEAS